MRFNLTTAGLLAAAVAISSVAGDRLEINEICTCFRIDALCGRVTGMFYTDFGQYVVQTSDGCRSTPVPGMTEFCMDWGKRRGHFRFSHQSFKRCLVEVGGQQADFCPPSGGPFDNICTTLFWDERPCTWRLPGDEEAGEVAEISSVVAAELPASTLVKMVKKGE